MSHINSLDEEPTAGFNLPTVYNLVYCSRAAPHMDEAAVTGIIAVARRCNPINAITGLLVFGSGVFFQWLEGPRDRVTQLMSNIKRDPRHDTIVELSESEEVRERVFPDWAMELVTAEDIRAVLEDALGTAKGAENKQALRCLLRHLDKMEVGGPRQR